MAAPGVPCGDTAAVLEAALGPFDVPWVPGDALPPVLRLHFEVDADNQCQDHVAFVAPGLSGPHLWLLDSYIGVRGRQVRAVAPQWLTHQVPALVAAAAGLAYEDLAAAPPSSPPPPRPAPAFCAAWASLLAVPLAAADFQAPLAVAVHARAPAAPPDPAHVAAVFLGTT